MMVIAGTLDGTIKVQAEDPQNAGAWADVDGMSWTALKAYPITLSAGLNYRLDLSGVTTTNVNATLV